MQLIINWQSDLKERAFYSPLRGSIYVGLLSENHHKFSLIVVEDLLLKALPPFCKMLFTPR